MDSLFFIFFLLSGGGGGSLGTILSILKFETILRFPATTCPAG